MALVFIEPAYAAPDPLSATLTLMSDFRIRGVSQDDGRITPQAEVDWAPENGWLAGARLSKVNFQDRERTSLESDFFGGKQIEFAGTSLVIEGIYYAYPERECPRGAARYSMGELTATASHSWDSLTLTAMTAWSPSYFDDGGTAWYVTAGGSYAISPSLSASIDVGRQAIQSFDGLSGAGVPYLNWDAGITATFDAASLDVRYVGTTLTHRECAQSQGDAHWCASTVILTLSYPVPL